MRIMRITESQLRRVIRQELVNEGILDSIKDLWKKDRNEASKKTIEQLYDFVTKFERAKDYKHFDAINDEYHSLMIVAKKMAKGMQSAPASEMKRAIKDGNAASLEAQDRVNAKSQKTSKSRQASDKQRAGDLDREDAERQKRYKDDEAYGKRWDEKQKSDKRWDKRIKDMKPSISRGTRNSGDAGAAN